MYPSVNGPKSVGPVVALFDEVYTTLFKEDEFDSLEGIKTQFLISKQYDDDIGSQVFAKTRTITNLEYLGACRMPADFRLVIEVSGYILKEKREKSK